MKKRDLSEAYKSYIKTSAVGLEVGLSIVIGAGAGYLADRYFGIRPWGLFFGFLVGVLAAAKRLYGFVRAYLKEGEKHGNNDKPDA